MDLTQRTLGSTALIVSPLCIGTSPLGSVPRVYGYEVAEEQALATMRAVFDGPINFLDTSNEYADGESERRIGEAIKERGGLPEGFVLATKVDPSGRGADIDFSGARVRRSIEESLERLDVDTLQLVYLHDPERIDFAFAMAPGGPVETLQKLRAEGTIGHVGVAGGPISLLEQFVDTGAFEVVITHNRFTLLDQSAMSLLTLCSERGVAVVNGAPFAGGMLAKGVGRQPLYAYREAPDFVRRRVEEMERKCVEADVPLAAAALQFSLKEAMIASTIVGMTRPERIAETIDLANHPIPDALWNELDDLRLPEEYWLA